MFTSMNELYRAIYKTRFGFVIKWARTIECQPEAFHCDLEPWEVGQYMGGN